MRSIEAHWRLQLALIAVGGIVLASWIVFGWIRDRNKAPSLVDDLHNNMIMESDIRSVEILKFDPGAGWPFQKQDYDRKARIRLPTTECGRLVTLLRKDSTDGWNYRNHPASFYHGILEFDMVDGGHYYLYYSLGFYKGSYFVEISANSKNSTNPNHAKDYENVALVPFLREHDPWFKDANSPPTWYRPGYPDNAP